MGTHSYQEKVFYRQKNFNIGFLATSCSNSRSRIILILLGEKEPLIVFASDKPIKNDLWLEVSMHTSNKLLRICILLFVLFNGFANPTRAEPIIYDQSHLLLTTRYGKLCSVCEATLLCSSKDISDVGVEDLSNPSLAPYTLYHFHAQNFWDQMALIVDWFLVIFQPARTSDQRPVSVYTIPTKGVTSSTRAHQTVIGDILSNPEEIHIGHNIIDRRSREWRYANGETLGQCKRLSLKETYHFLKSHEPWPILAE